MQKMLKLTLCLSVGVFLLGSAFCDIKCPDGSACPDLTTCCLTTQGYGCCPYPKAVCCIDKAHCCPYGYRCNLSAQTCDKQDQPWISVPMANKVDAEVPSSPDLPLTSYEEVENNDVPEPLRSTVVHCDNYYYCPDATTCCRHPKGAWFCCPYSPGRCCLDGYHCCPYGYDCDLTYTHCVRQGLKYPFPYKQARTSVLASRFAGSEDRSNVQKEEFAALTETRGSS